MADTSTTTNDLKIGFQFEDEDTRLVSLKDPKANLTSSTIKEVTDYLINNKVIIGDKDKQNAQLPVKVYTCYQEQTSTTKLDLTEE